MYRLVIDRTCSISREKFKNEMLTDFGVWFEGAKGLVMFHPNVVSNIKLQYEPHDAVLSHLKPIFPEFRSAKIPFWEDIINVTLNQCYDKHFFGFEWQNFCLQYENFNWNLSFFTRGWTLMSSPWKKIDT